MAMTDPVTILTTITQSLGVVKVIQDLLKKDKPDVLALREHITELRQQLLDAKESVLALQSENLDQKSQVATLVQEIDALTSNKPEFEHGAYWFDGAGPYCTGCWDDARKRIRLNVIKATDYKLLGGNCQCPKCKMAVTIEAKWLP